MGSILKDALFYSERKSNESEGGDFVGAALFEDRGGYYTARVVRWEDIEQTVALFDESFFTDYDEALADYNNRSAEVGTLFHYAQ